MNLAPGFGRGCEVCFEKQKTNQRNPTFDNQRNSHLERLILSIARSFTFPSVLPVTEGGSDLPTAHGEPQRQNQIPHTGSFYCLEVGGT